MERKTRRLRSILKVDSQITVSKPSSLMEYSLVINMTDGQSKQRDILQCSFRRLSLLPWLLRFSAQEVGGTYMLMEGAKVPVTMFTPLKAYNAGPGTKVGVIGIGGLGHLGVVSLYSCHSICADEIAIRQGDGSRSMGYLKFRV